MDKRTLKRIVDSPPRASREAFKKAAVGCCRLTRSCRTFVFRYDAIISVSTLEHIGTYETPRNPGRAAPAVGNLVGLLKPGGELVATAPLGLNHEFDALVERGGIPFGELYALRRVGRGNEWEEADFSAVEGAEYPKSAFGADAIIVGIIRKGQAVSAQ